MNVTLAFQFFGVTESMQLFCSRIKKLIKAMNCRTLKNAMKLGNEAWKRVPSDSTCHGFKVSLKDILEVCRYLTKDCGFDYLMTSEIQSENQNNLKLFFGMMHSYCGSNDHLDSTLFIQIYRLILIYSLASTKGSNIFGEEILKVLLIKASEN
ncbi:PREDICTED: uncharacterized protein LOC108692123 [Atta colombica]|uniref:uncharacterized protein LOC108692123 n=1 Tax=Atta colombica TaxID=520822 RepID=UPI00084CD4B8|nr:PREDICTED: uncharacterized protein LOC108692123 [Atta colombica]